MILFLLHILLLIFSSCLSCYSSTQTDLSCLPPHLLPPLTHHLDHLDLSDSRLTTAHLEQLLAVLPHSALRLSVSISYLNMAQMVKWSNGRNPARQFKQFNRFQKYHSHYSH